METALPITATISRRERKRETTRGAIVEAGQILFAKRPVDAVSIDEITDAADVSKGSFYNHFSDKENLASTIIEIVQADLERSISRANAGIDNAAARVARALCVVLHYSIAFPNRVEAMMSLSERRTVANTPLNAGVAADVRAGIAKGLFKAVDLETGVVLVTGTVLITLRHVRSSGSKTPLTSIAAAMSAALLRGLGVPGGQAAKHAQAAAKNILGEVAP